jgi:hypothetical protein
MLVRPSQAQRPRNEFSSLLLPMLIRRKSFAMQAMLKASFAGS